MKVGLLLLTVAASGIAVAVAVAGLLVASDLTVESTYVSIAEAKLEGGAIANGWLPASLPRSTHQIRTVNDLDHNTSSGHFHFSPQDSTELAVAFKAGSPPSSRYESWSEVIKEERRAGKALYWHKEERQTWVFFCVESKGRCDYLMW